MAFKKKKKKKKPFNHKTILKKIIIVFYVLGVLYNKNPLVNLKNPYPDLQKLRNKRLRTHVYSIYFILFLFFLQNFDGDNIQ